MLASRFFRSSAANAVRVQGRWASAQATTKPKKEKKLVESKSFAMNLFRGRAAVEQAFPYPLNLDEDRRETLQMILGPTQKFLEEVNNPAENDEKAQIPMEKLKQFAELGAFGAVVPEEYEGAGLVNTQMARLAEIVGSNDLALGVVMGAHQSIGYKGILLFGTPEQKKKYLPDVATARKFAAFCLTEPSSGSDANSIRSRAVKSDDGSHYVLNGSKVWISNGGFAEVFTVFAQTPIKQVDGSTKDKVSAFIVERGFGGVTNGLPEKKMGIKGSNTAEVYFDNVKIPAENLLGVEGDGFKVAMNILNNGRFGIPAAMTGCMKWCIKKSIDHVNQRVQFGKKIKEFGDVQEKIAAMITKMYATESVVYMLAANMDRNVQDYQLEAAIGKVLASDSAWSVCDDAIQLHGGMGFMKETGLERVQRDIRIFRIFEGANDVMKLFVSLTGAQYAGKHLQQLAKDIKAGGIGTLFGEIKRRATGGEIDFSSSVHPKLSSEASLLAADINTFGRTFETLLAKHKKGIIDRQYELTRLANAAIDIYSTICVLSRASYVLEKDPSSEQDLKIAQLHSKTAHRRIQNSLKEVASLDSAELSLIYDISKAVFDNEGIVNKHVIDV